MRFLQKLLGQASFCCFLYGPGHANNDFHMGWVRTRPGNFVIPGRAWISPEKKKSSPARILEKKSKDRTQLGLQRVKTRDGLSLQKKIMNWSGKSDDQAQPKFCKWKLGCLNYYVCGMTEQVIKCTASITKLSQDCYCGWGLLLRSNSLCIGTIFMSLIYF